MSTAAAQKLEAFAGEIGQLPDRDIAERAGVTTENVRMYRLRRGIPAAWRQNPKPPETDMPRTLAQVLGGLRANTETAIAKAIEAVNACTSIEQLEAGMRVERSPGPDRAEVVDAIARRIGALQLAAVDAKVAERKAAAGNDATPKASAVVELALEQLVLDPELQCRAGGLVEETVESYAEVLRAGGTLPAIRVYQVDGAHLVVDGWHRHAAHVKAERGTIAAEVLEGTRRDALLAAVKANSDHGLPRTQADKQRAVRRLLMDPEWCKLPSRKLCELAAVSHTFVDQLRKRYGVKAGEVLLEEHAREIDGEPAPAWKPLLSENEYVRADVEKIRLSKDVGKLAEVSQYGTVGKALELRLSELAIEPWPWPEDMTAEEMEARCAVLDTEEDIEKAIRAKDCPNRAAMMKLLREVRELPKRTWGLENAVQAYKDRPALRARASELLKAEKARQAEFDRTDPWRIWRRIADMKDPVEQEAAFRAAPEKVRTEHARPSELLPAFRDGAYRSEFVPDAKDCPDPSCGGWVLPGKYGDCIRCRNQPTYATKHMEEALTGAAKLLEHPGYALRVSGDHDAVLVDSGAVEVLRQLQHRAAGDPVHAWLRKAPAEVKAALAAWEGNAVLVMVGDPHATRNAVGDDDGDDACENCGNHDECAEDCACVAAFDEGREQEACGVCTAANGIEDEDANAEASAK